MSSSIVNHCSGRTLAARVRGWLVVCVALPLLSGCGTEFVYNRLDWLTHYYLSSQVSLDGPQSHELRRALDGFFQWHRRSELPRYAAFLDRMAQDSNRALGVEHFETGRREIESFVRDAVARGAPDAARWLSGLRPAQVDELFASFAASERKAARKSCRIEPAERRTAAIERFTEHVEDWTGRLSRSQRQLIAAAVTDLEGDPCAEVSIRERSRIAFRSLVDRYREHPEFATHIATFLMNPQNRWDAEYRRKVEADRVRLNRLLADIHHSLSPVQRTHAVARLREYAEDLRALSIATGT